MAKKSTDIPVRKEGVAIKREGKKEGGMEKFSGFPWHPLEALRDEIDELFEGFGSRSRRRRPVFDLTPWRGFGAELSFGGMTPRVDVSEDEKSIAIKAELPGMDEKNIEVEVSDGLLIIKGEKKEEVEEKKKNYHMSERRFGSFQRSFRLPESVDQDKVAGTFEKGVLMVTLPKSAQSRKAQRKIEIRSR